MPDPARFRPFLWAAIGVCLTAGLVAVPVVDGETEVRAGGRPPAGAGDVTTTTESPYCAANGGCGGGDAAPPDAGAGAAPRGGGAEGGGGSTDAGAGGAVGPAPGSSRGGPTGAGPDRTSPPAPAATTPPAPTATDDLGTPTDPGPAVPPRPGTYRTRSTGPRGEQEMTTRIEDRGTMPSERRQLVSMRGGDFDADNDVAWRPDGVHVLSTVIMLGSSKGTCDWNPDTVQLRLPITKGTTWDSSSTCSMTGLTPTPIPLNRRITGKVIELRRVRIAGQVVDAWAIEGTEHLDGAGQSVDRAGIVLFSPKHGIVVSEEGKVTTPDGTFDYRSEALNLDPE